MSTVTGSRTVRYLIVLGLCTLALSSSLPAAAQEETSQEPAGENPSNPLAKVKNTDLRWQYLDVDPVHINDIFLDGAFMASDEIKIRYELHYWETDLTGRSQSGFESFLLKGIWFPREGVWGGATAPRSV